jgi:hypothetical protein
MSYIITKIRNEKVFDLDKVTNMGINDLIKELYCRNYKNPLEFLMKNKLDKEFLDDCYKEFMENGEFLNEYAIGTDFYNAVKKFKESGEISVTILYKNDIEKYIIDHDPLLSTLKSVESNTKKYNFYSQFYFKYVEDAKNYIENITRKTYYFSSCALNLNATNDDFKDSEIIQLLIDLKNNISIFDMYRQEVVGRVLQ